MPVDYYSSAWIESYAGTQAYSTYRVVCNPNSVTLYTTVASSGTNDWQNWIVTGSGNLLFPWLTQGTGEYYQVRLSDTSQIPGQLTVQTSELLTPEQETERQVQEAERRAERQALIAERRAREDELETRAQEGYERLRREHEQRRIQQEQEAAECLERATTLLLGCLDDNQTEEYNTLKTFHVVGASGRRYRIGYGHAGNVAELDNEGKAIVKFCIHASIHMPVPDTMLTQKLLLETNEEEFRKIANQTPVRMAA